MGTRYGATVPGRVEGNAGPQPGQQTETHRSVTLALLQRLPSELRERPQWLLAGPNAAGELKVPTSVALDGSGEPRLVPGSHSDPGTWLDFAYAYECAQEFGLELCYVLSADDPFAVMD